MSDTLSALGRAAYGGSVLESIAHPQVVNPLAAYAGAVQTARGVYDLRGQQAQQALGQTYQDAIDPQTGRFDPLQFNALLSQRPAAAMAAQSGVESSQKLQGDQFNLNTAQNGALNGALAGVLKLPDDQLAQGVVQQTQRLISAGVIPPDRAHAALLGLNGNDPATLRTQLETMWRGTLPAQQQQTVTYGQPGTVTAPGGNLTGYRQDPTTGAVTGGPGSVPQGLPAEVLDRPYTYNDPKTGQPVTTTLRQFYIDHGYSYAAQGGPGGAPGSLPSSLRGPNAAPPASAPASLLVPAAPPGTTPAPAPAATPATQPVGNQGLVQNPDGSVGMPGGGFSRPPTPAPRPVATGPAPADLEAQKQQAAQSTTGFQSISDQAVASRPRSAILGNMLGDTTQFATGPTADIVGRTRNLAISLGIPGINTEAQSAKESFVKLAAGLAQQQMGGAPSDARQSMNVAANPHVDLSPGGVDLMIRQLQGNEDYLQARGQLAANYGENNIRKFESEVGAKLDPRAFQFARMSVPQRQAYVKGLSDKDKAAVQSSYNWAVGQKLIGGG